MKMRFFEGPAGSGKTYRLMTELAAILKDRPLDQDERVLALTRMHGSRRRLQQRLSAMNSLRGRFECVTMDSFAYRILRRWRSLSRRRFSAECANDDYKETCRRAGILLADRIVGKWTAQRFPIMILDEMQDSKGGQLLMIQALADLTVCLAAADAYQDLDCNQEEPNAAVSWAQEHAEVIPLTGNHRTTAAGLLDAARALRSGQDVLEGSNFHLLGAPNKDVGASFVSQNLVWWKGCKDIALVTPVGKENSAFVRDVISRVERAPIGKENVGPHRIPWEISQEEEETEFIAHLDLPQDPLTKIQGSQVAFPKEHNVSQAMGMWLDKQWRVGGRAIFTVAEVRDQIRLIYQQLRAYRRTTDGGIRAITIHQAKNREFHSVIVLWPYEVQGSSERQRRLLYNAITRAKSRTVVIVQNPDRLKKQPFVQCGDNARTPPAKQIEMW